MKDSIIVPFGFLLLASLVSGQQRWYYTGKFLNEDIIIPFFEGLQYKQSELVDPYGSHLLYFGGIVAKAETLNTTEYGSVAELLRGQLLGLGNSSTVAIERAKNYPLVMSRNYAAYIEILNNRSSDGFETLQYQAEVGLYDHRARVFLEKYWRDLQVGELTALEISIEQTAQPSSQTDQATTLDSVPAVVAVDVSASGDAVISDMSSTGPAIVDVKTEAAADAAISSPPIVSPHEAANGPKLVHKVLYTTDIMGRVSIYSHTWNSTASQPLGSADAAENQEELIQTTEKKDLRVMSFNLWHNNPPSWVYHNPK